MPTAAYTTFAVRVARTRRLSPSFVRVTFTGERLDRFADNGFDQRFKLVLPLPDRGLDGLPTGPDWYPRWRALPDGERHPVRTYTVRAVRPGEREVDVDMVLHGDAGPASRFAEQASPGDEAVLVGPDAAYPGDHAGVTFAPPPGSRLVVAGDETAVPAACSILERLDPRAEGVALLEVPRSADVVEVAAPAGVDVRWLPRDGAPHGSRLAPAVLRLLDGHPGAPSRDAASDPDDEDLLWDVPDTAETSSGRPYVWLAGEATVLRRLRRQLLGGLGFDRRSVAVMGYWRAGHPGA